MTRQFVFETLLSCTQTDTSSITCYITDQYNPYLPITFIIIIPFKQSANRQYYNMIPQTPVGLNFIHNHPPSDSLIETLAKVASDPQAEAVLRVFASRDNNFTDTITKILVAQGLAPQIKLTAASFLALLLKDHIQATKSNAHFEMVSNILMNSRIDLECRMSFLKCVSEAIGGDNKCVKVEEIVNLMRNLFLSDMNGKILAMRIIECEAVANQSESDFLYFVNAVTIETASQLIPLISEQTIQLLEEWARNTIFMMDKLIINQKPSFGNSASSDMIGYFCSSETLSQLILKCYYLKGDEKELEEMKTSVCTLHYKILTQVFKLDKQCSTIHFKYLHTLLPMFVEAILNPQYITNNQQLCIYIISILNICCKQQSFNFLFSQLYILLINSILPLFKLDSTDIHNFEEDPQEFILALDEICDAQTSDTLRGESAKLILSLCYHQDGAATYLFSICSHSMRKRVDSEFIGSPLIPSQCQLEIDQTFLILSIITQFIETREDFQQELRDILSTKKQQFLTELTDIQLGMLYFFFSYSYQTLFPTDDDVAYVVSASSSTQHPTVNYLGLDFLSHLTKFETNLHIVKNLTLKLKTENLEKYDQIYSDYLNKTFSKLSEDDLIFISNCIMERIKSEMDLPNSNKEFHQITLAFNILSIITSKAELLKIDTKLCHNLKQIYQILANPNFPCLEKVLETLNHILLSYKTPTNDEFETLKYIRRIIEVSGSVESTFVTLALFVRKTNIKEKTEIILYLLELIKLSCKSNSKEETSRCLDVGEGLLLLRLFVRKFGSVLPEEAKKDVLEFLPQINIGKSLNLQAILANVYLKLYPSYPSTAFRTSLIESISVHQNMFFEEERKSAIQGLCDMIMIQKDKDWLKQQIFITARLLEQHRLEVENRQSNPNKKSEKLQAQEKQRIQLTKSNKRMLMNIKKQDVFADFSNAINGIRQHNEPLYNNVIAQLPQYLHLKLKQLLPIREVSKQLRVINKVLKVKESVEFQPSVGEEKKTKKRKRAQKEEQEDDDG